MKSRNAALLLDLDDMLTNYGESTDTCIVWNGGQPLWHAHLTCLIEAAQKANILLYIGIATFKKKYSNPANEKHGLMGDPVSAVVLEDQRYMDAGFACIGLGHNQGLKNLIHPQLVFFTGNQCKTLHALDKVRDVIEANSSSSLSSLSSSSSSSSSASSAPIISKADTIIMDDDSLVCETAKQHGYSSVCVGNLSKLTYQSQKSRIAKSFLALFDLLKLELPQQIVEQAKIQEMVTGELSNFFSRLLVQGASGNSDDKKDAEPIRGLDEEDEAPANSPRL
jgi:hypothetical protein